MKLLLATILLVCRTAAQSLTALNTTQTEPNVDKGLILGLQSPVLSGLAGFALIVLAILLLWCNIATNCHVYDTMTINGTAFECRYGDYPSEYCLKCCCAACCYTPFSCLASPTRFYQRILVPCVHDVRACCYNWCCIGSSYSLHCCGLRIPICSCPRCVSPPIEIPPPKIVIHQGYSPVLVENLGKNTTCVICFNPSSNRACDLCPPTTEKRIGHCKSSIACETCYPDVIEAKLNKCPTCRAPW
jgi:hypothetical protein